MGFWIMDYTLDELHEALKFLCCWDAEISGLRNLTQLSISVGVNLRCTFTLKGDSASLLGILFSVFTILV